MKSCNTIVAFALLSLTACDLFGLEPEDGTFAGNNNNTLVEGQAFGEGEGPRTKTVDAGVEGSTELSSSWSGDSYSGLNVQTAQLAEHSSYTDVYIEVTNDGTLALCNVEATLIEYRDRDGGVLDSGDPSVLNGESANLRGLDWTLDDCLAPGSTGFFVATLGLDVPIDDVNDIRLYLSAVDAREEDAPRADVVATDFAADDIAGYGALTVELQNVGTEAARIDMVLIARFDADETFLGYELTTAVSPEVLHPGKEGSATIPLLDVDGRTTSAIVHVTWDESGV